MVFETKREKTFLWENCLFWKKTVKTFRKKKEKGKKKLERATTPKTLKKSTGLKNTFLFSETKCKGLCLEEILTKVPPNEDKVRWRLPKLFVCLSKKSTFFASLGFCKEQPDKKKLLCKFSNCFGGGILTRLVQVQNVESVEIADGIWGSNQKGQVSSYIFYWTVNFVFLQQLSPLSKLVVNFPQNSG